MPAQPIHPRSWDDPLGIGDPQCSHARIGQIVRLLSWVTIGIGVVATALGAVTGRVTDALAALTMALLAGWITRMWRGTPSHGVARFVGRLCVAMLMVIVLFAVLLPQIGPGVIYAGLIPLVVGLPYLGRTALLRLAIAAWVLGVVITIFGELSPGVDIGVPGWVLSVRRVIGVAVVAGAIVALSWQHRGRLARRRA